jgi:PPM family protein phosphatase
MPSQALPEIESGGISLVGPVREDNQDTIRLPDDSHPLDLGYLFAVADGMGGYAHGGMASNLAIQSLYEAYYSRLDRSPQKALQIGVDRANLNVFQTAQRLGVNRMGTTLTAAGIRGRKMFLAHVGDSRAYLLRGGKITCLTQDHTTVGDLVRMKVISPDKVRTHSQRSILNRAIGLTLFVKPDITEFSLEEGDRLVLCSDGLWSVIEDDDFAGAIRKAPSAEALSQKLADMAIDYGTDDNVSAISIFVHALADVPAGVSNGSRWKWLDFLRDLRFQDPNGTSVDTAQS